MAALVFKNKGRLKAFWETVLPFLGNLHSYLKLLHKSFNILDTVYVDENTSYTQHNEEDPDTVSFVRRQILKP